MVSSHECLSFTAPISSDENGQVLKFLTVLYN